MTTHDTPAPETTRRSTAGFIDAHSHLRATSYAEHGIGGATLEEGLLRMTAMTSVDIEDDAFVACCELIAKGVTGVQVMFHTFGDGDDYLEALDATLAGVRRSGIRALIVLGTTDQAEYFPPTSVAPAGLESVAQAPRRLSADVFAGVVAQATQQYPDITFGVGPVGPQWCSDALLHAIGEISQQGYRVHSHAAESVSQRSWAGDLITRLERAGLLGPQTSLAHGVWLTDVELHLLADLGVSLVTCPLSNHLLSAGTANVSGWRAAGVSFGVGLDSADRAATPMSVALRALTATDAEHALTVGGTRATGVDSSLDRVEWTDDGLEVPHTVIIEGVERVADSSLVNRHEVDEARNRIAEAMLRDAAERARRHAVLDDLMPIYLETVRRAVDAR